MSPVQERTVLRALAVTLLLSDFLFLRGPVILVMRSVQVVAHHRFGLPTPLPLYRLTRCPVLLQVWWMNSKGEGLVFRAQQEKESSCCCCKSSFCSHLCFPACSEFCSCPPHLGSLCRAACSLKVCHAEPPPSASGVSPAWPAWSSGRWGDPCAYSGLSSVDQQRNNSLLTHSFLIMKKYPGKKQQEAVVGMFG